MENKLHPLTLLSPDTLPDDSENGKLVAIEGIDGSGKTTITNEVVEELRKKGFEATVFRNFSGETAYWQTVMEMKRGLESEGRPIDPETDQVLHTMEFLTYCNATLPGLLRENDFVLADRYYLGKIVISRIDTKTRDSYAEKLIKYAVDNGTVIRPDSIFLLDTAVEVARDRILKRGKSLEFKESEEMLAQAVAEFEAVLKDDSLYEGNVHIISSDQDVETIAYKLIQLIT